jgi:heme/copper-type cytochrome/quinol oxidase subunit 2
MGGIKDYTYQNIIFVHDFVYIFLILVFIIIIAYFIIIFVEYKIENYKNYFKLFMNKKIKEIRILKNLKKNKINTKNISKQHTLLFIQKYGIHLKSVLNQVHNLKLEIIWTFIPIFIILELIFPSLSLIADDEISNKASLYTVNVIGNQWYWTYELNTAMGIIKQVSNLALIDELDLHNRNYARLLATTNAISIPVGLKTSFFITSNDVAHSWAIQGLGIKVDAIPGRINLKTVIASKIGLYTGMCSELCGIEHGFMPISLQVLTLNNWGYNLEYMSEKVLTYTDIKNIWYI